MAINLKALKPNKVSADLSSYVTYIFSYPKAGKTTLASQFPDPLIIATEKGYLTLPGVVAQDVASWADIKSVVRQLHDNEIKEQFKTIVIDTVDLAASMCEKYICNQNDVETLSQIPYGGGWTKVKKEWEDTFLKIRNEGYALVFISHSKDKTFTRKDGSTYNQVVASCPTTYNEILKGMSDIIGYIDIVDGERELVLRSPDNSIDVGCRFKNIANSIPLGYDELVKALNDAINSEAKQTNNKFVTKERATATKEAKYDYQSMMTEFQEVVGALMAKDKAGYAPKITEITTQILGKGKKFTECTEAQVELMSLVLEEVKALA